MAAFVVSFLMENLEELIKSERYLILEEEDQIECLYEDLRLLSAFLEDLQEKFYEHEEVKNLEARIRNVAYEAKNTVDLFVFNAKLNEEEEVVEKKKKKYVTKRKKDAGRVEKNGHNGLLNLGHVKQQIEAIKTEVMEIYNKKINDMEAIQIANNPKWELETVVGFDEEATFLKELPTGANFSIGGSPRANTPTWEEETIVGFEEELTIIKEQLIGGPKKLEIISIFGMAGLGKTTLARKVYNDPLVVYHFYIHSWISISQEYRKRDLVNHLLSSVMQRTNEIDQMSDEESAQQLYKHLKGQRYFIVMDDIWDNRAWDDLRNYFPNDNNGSRIMFTTRNKDAALHAKPNIPPLSLRFLTHDESWDLLQQKAFQRETCPPYSMEIGKQIAKKCQGLPLAIVVVAGILAKKERSQDRWRQVGDSINSWMASGPQLWKKTLALSYNHLSHHLKKCFLYFGVFPKDFHVLVWKLIWLWVAEGFIQKTGEKSLEDVAEEHLMDLIGRSLVIVSRRGYDGGVKSCGIHDLLRDFCIKQAEKEHFLQHMVLGQRASSSSNSKHLCIKNSENAWTATSLICSPSNSQIFFCFNSRCIGSCRPDIHYRCFKLLRVFDVNQITRYSSEIEKHCHLRYLALGTLHMYSEISLPASISKFHKLETLIIDARSSVTLPHWIRKMVKLRHVRLTGPWIHKIESQDPNARYPFSLDDLQILSRVNPWSCEDFLAGTPNLRMLGFRGHIVDRGCLSCPGLDFLNHLQELKLFNTSFAKSGGWSVNGSVNLGGVRFPTNLKRLTLSRSYLNWDEMSTLDKLLPNLEVLKLLNDAFKGPVWETRGDFPNLKFLKFESLDIVLWNASSNHFPKLQRLALVGCYWLKEIPYEMGDIPTLQKIEVRFCNSSLANSAREIKEEQESVGNNSLQVVTSTVICRTTDDEGRH